MLKEARDKRGRGAAGETPVFGLLKGKFGAVLEVKWLSKENHTFKQWEPVLPETFPKKAPLQYMLQSGLAKLQQMK